MGQTSETGAARCLHGRRCAGLHRGLDVGSWVVRPTRPVDVYPSWIVFSSTILSLRVFAGSLRMVVSPTAFPTSDRPIGDDMLTCPSSNSTESPNTRL